MALNDILFSEDFLFEGEQADAYRTRKAAEKDQAKAEDERRHRHATKSIGISGMNNYQNTSNAIKRIEDEHNQRRKEVSKAERQYKKAEHSADRAEKQYGTNSYEHLNAFRNKHLTLQDAKRKVDNFRNFHKNDQSVAAAAALRHQRKHENTEFLYNGAIELI